MGFLYKVNLDHIAPFTFGAGHVQARLEKGFGELEQLSDGVLEDVSVVNDGDTWLRARMPSDSRQIVQFVKVLGQQGPRAAAGFTFRLASNFDLKTGADLIGGKMGPGLLAGTLLEDPANKRQRRPNWIKAATPPGGGYQPSLSSRLSARLMFRYSAALGKTVLGLYGYMVSRYPGEPAAVCYGLNLQSSVALERGGVYDVSYEVNVLANSYTLELNGVRSSWQLEGLNGADPAVSLNGAPAAHSWGNGLIDGLWFSHFCGGEDSPVWWPEQASWIDYKDIRVASSISEL